MLKLNVSFYRSLLLIIFQGCIFFEYPCPKLVQVTNNQCRSASIGGKGEGKGKQTRKQGYEKVLIMEEMGKKEEK